MKTFKEMYDSLDEKTMGKAQRKKQGRRMAKLQRSSAFQMKKKRNALRTKDTAKLAVIAKKKATQVIRDKFYKDYKNMSLTMRVQADQKIQQKYGAMIAKKAKKMLPQLKSDEKVRVKAARAAYKDKDKGKDDGGITIGNYNIKLDI
jgi:hypothetical protein